MDLSGILSQAGFAFQMKVFLKQVTELNPNAVASYEYLDDISASTSLDELSGRIGLCESRLIQVKNTNVGKRDVVQIYTNWILAVSKHDRFLPFGFFIRMIKAFPYILMPLPPFNSLRVLMKGLKSPVGQMPRS